MSTRFHPVAYILRMLYAARSSNEHGTNVLIGIQEDADNGVNTPCVIAAARHPVRFR